MGKIRFLFLTIVLLGVGIYLYSHFSSLFHKRKISSPLATLPLESVLKNITLSGKSVSGSWRLIAGRVYIKRGESDLILSNPRLFFYKENKKFYISAERGEYNRNLQIIHLWRRVRGRYKDITIYSEEGFYYIKTGHVKLNKKVVVSSDFFKILSKSALVDLKKEKVLFEGSVDFILKNTGKKGEQTHVPEISN